MPFESFEEEETRLREAVRLAPDDAEAHFNLGFLLRRFLCDMEKTKEAEKELKEALRLNPGHDQALWRLAGVLFNHAKYAEVVPAFLESIRRNPKRDHSSTRWQIGYALLRQWKYQEAEEWFRKSLRKDRTYERVRYDLSEALWKQGKFKEAVKVLLRPPRMKRGNPEFHYRLGRCYAQWGKEKEALKSLQSTIAKWSRQLEAVVKERPSKNRNPAHEDPRVGTLERFMLWLSPDLKSDGEWDSLRNDKRFKKLAADTERLWAKREKALKMFKMKRLRVERKVTRKSKDK